MSQVQLRLPEKTLEQIDCWVAEGKFKSRSDAIRTIMSPFEVREKTREFFQMLQKRSQKAKDPPKRQNRGIRDNKMGAKLGFITPTVMQALEFFLEDSLNEYHEREINILSQR
jgi:Arc/MetJ-type ribon-helix-helix transcriptional regulator